MNHLYSMTGFGKAVSQENGKKFTVEIKSLNSKQSDIGIRMPNFYKEKEAEVRKMLSEELQRGKIELNLYCELNAVDKAPRINQVLVGEYMKQLKSLCELNGVQGDIIGAVMRLPDVLKNPEEEIDPNEWLEVKAIIETAIKSLMEFRSIEGEQLKLDLYERLSVIRRKMDGMADLEEDRVNRIKARLNKSLVELDDKIDDNRFEQELIYYLEKLDITEEKVRLKAHLDYFEDLLKEGGMIGKKLGFIGQEIGREINTMGSKANHAQMQKLVVEMKDELEKIKEQVLNIL